jgi:hypothetical protein
VQKKMKAPIVPLKFHGTGDLNEAVEEKTKQPT